MTNPPHGQSATEAPEAKVATKAGLYWPFALIASAANWSLDFYPRLLREQKVCSIDTSALIQEHVAATARWNALEVDDHKIDSAIELAKASLNEAKSQTEYQDQKATRLLTVTTFLSALSAGLYAGFNSAYPVGAIWQGSGWFAGFQVAAHLTFLAFVLAVVGGMLITFHATRTRFKYPGHATAKRQSGPTKSYLFFREIIGVSPTGWANSFVTADEDGKPVLNPNLKIEYLKNYVGEAYLIAAKTADKLRYLEPAQSLLAWALRFLLLFVVLIAAVSIAWPTSPSKLQRIETGDGRALPVRVVP